MKIKLLFFLISFFAIGCGSTSSLTSPREPETPEQTFQFVEDVLLGTEYFRSAPVVTKWVKKPTLSVFYGTVEDEWTIEQMVREMNQIFEGTRFSVRLMDPHFPKADIKVLFAPEKEFPNIANMRMFSYVPGNRGYYHLWWTAHHEIERAIVLIDTGLKGKQRKHFIREEITQALGFANDSPISKSSVFYGEGRTGGKALAYSPLDRKLMKFTYQKLKPGQDRIRLFEAFQKYWDEIEA